MIELDQVAHSYGGGELFAEVSLTLSPGAFLFLTGPSGAGKTTLLKLCYGDLLPSAGQVQIFGKALRRMSRDDIALARRRIGVVHQDCQFLDHLPLAENVALPLAVSGRGEVAGSAADLADLLGWVGLSDRADALPPTLSGGERQRAALARAVITAPDVLLADEPTGNLDSRTSGEIMELVTGLNRRQGITVVMVTHEADIAAYADRVVRFRDGRIESDSRNDEAA